MVDAAICPAELAILFLASLVLWRLPRAVSNFPIAAAEWSLAVQRCCQWLAAGPGLAELELRGLVELPGIQGGRATTRQMALGATMLLLALPTASAACAGGNFHAGLNCNGHSLIPKPPMAASASECCGVCAATPGCTAWSWNEGGNRLCYPKLNCTQPRLDKDTVSGGAVHAPPAPGPAPGPAPVPAPGPHSTVGILNATLVGVDNTGTRDTTKSLQAAIVAAYDAQLALFLPPGRYLVSDTLWANQSNYGKCPQDHTPQIDERAIAIKLRDSLWLQVRHCR